MVASVVPGVLMLPATGTIIVTHLVTDRTAVTTLLEQDGITVEGVCNMADSVPKIASLVSLSSLERTVPVYFNGNSRIDADTDSAE